MPTDPFTRADAATLGANWTTIMDDGSGNAMQIAGNAAIGYGTGFPNHLVYWNADTPTANQFSEIEIEDDALGFYVGVRINGSLGAVNGVVLKIDQFNDLIGIYRFDAGVKTILDTLDASPTFTDHDLWRLTVTGTSYVATKNGTPVGSPVVDATYATGTYGFASFSQYDIVYAWTGGDVAGGGGNPQIPFLRL